MDLIHEFKEITGEDLSDCVERGVGIIWWKAENKLFKGYKPVTMTFKEQLLDKYGIEAYNLINRINDKWVKDD